MVLKSGFVVMLLLVISDCYSYAQYKPPSANIISKDTKRMVISTPISKGRDINNIVFFQEQIGNRWILQFRRIGGLVVTNEASDAATHVNKLEISEYSMALDKSLSLVEKEYPNNYLSQVQLDVCLVSELWEEVVAITKYEGGKLSGEIDHKSKKLQSAIIRTLMESYLMSITCDVLKKHSYECDKSAISINPVAFKSEYFRKDWTTILSLPDAGLQDTMWFGINVKNKD